MKATTTIDDKLLDNSQAFKGEFYERFTLRHADRPLQLTPKLSKNYLFPTFYGDVTCAIGIFMCSLEKARDLLPSKKMRPVRMGKGRALVVFSNYAYKNVLGVAPYNEIAMTIPVLVGDGMDLPVLPMVAAKFFKGAGYYCFSMPVTSLENQIRGEKIWGLPKIVQEIDIQKSGGQCRVEARDEKGEAYYKITIPTTGGQTHFDVGTDLYTIRDGHFLQSRTNFKGNFHVTKHMDRLFKSGGTPSQEWLSIGKGPAAHVLRTLDIDPNPFQFRYAEGMSSCFDLPNPEFKG